LPKEIKPKHVKPSSNPALRDLIERACDVLIANEAALNALDAKVGDGYGSTMAVRHELEIRPERNAAANTSEFCKPERDSVQDHGSEVC
jgi:hypothetical protein